MFEYLRGLGKPKPEVSGEVLKLETGGRPFYASTTSSDDLARHLLAQAQEKAANLDSGAKVTVEVDEARRNIHHLELTMSLMRLAHEYGLRTGDNTYTFQKI